MNVSRIVSLFGMAIMVMAGPTAALAREVPGVYPGAACQPSTHSDKIVRKSDGGMYSADSVTRTWLCPVKRDWENGGSIEFGQVTVVEASYQRTTCTIYSKWETGGTYNALTGSSTTLSGTRKITFGAGSADAVYVPKYGYVYFLCTVPPGSGILNYRATENVGEY